jgi:hypothetical protein
MLTRGFYCQENKENGKIVVFHRKTCSNEGDIPLGKSYPPICSNVVKPPRQNISSTINLTFLGCRRITIWRSCSRPELLPPLVYYILDPFWCSTIFYTCQNRMCHSGSFLYMLYVYKTSPDTLGVISNTSWIIWGFSKPFRDQQWHSWYPYILSLYSHSCLCMSLTR